MPDRIQFPPEPSPENLAQPKPKPLFESTSGFIPPAPDTDQGPAQGFEPPPAETGTPLDTPETRSWWAQRVDSTARGIIQANQMINVMGGLLAASAKDRYIDQMAELDREDERQKVRDQMEIDQGIKEILAQNPDTPDEDIQKWAATQQARFDARDARRAERRAEMEQKLRDLEAGSDEEIAQKAERLSILSEALEDIPQSEVMQKFQESEGTREALGVLLSNPSGFLDLTLESGTASAGAMAGAAALGTLAGPLGTAAGAFVGGMAPEMAGRIMELMGEMDVDMRDAAQIEAFMRDPKMRAEAYRKGAIKGLTISSIDALFAGLGGKVFTKAVQKGAGKATRTAALGVDTAINIAGEGLGEAAGGVLSGQGLSAKDIIAEMGGVGPQAAIEIGTNIYYEARKARDEAVDPIMDIIRLSTQALDQATRTLQLAEQVERENAANASEIGDNAIAGVTADPNKLDDPDAVAKAQQGIQAETEEALANQAAIKAEAEAAMEEAKRAAQELEEAKALLESPEVKQLEFDFQDAEQLMLHLQTIEEVAKTDPDIAVQMRHPYAAQAFLAYQQENPGVKLTEIEENGIFRPAMFMGYNGPNSVQIGVFNPETGIFEFSTLQEGQTLQTTIPSYEEWKSTPWLPGKRPPGRPTPWTRPARPKPPPRFPTLPPEQQIPVSTATEPPAPPAAPTGETLTLESEEQVAPESLQDLEQRRVEQEDGRDAIQAQEEFERDMELAAQNEQAGEQEVQAMDLQRDAEALDEQELEMIEAEQADLAREQQQATEIEPVPDNTRVTIQAASPEFKMDGYVQVELFDQEGNDLESTNPETLARRGYSLPVIPADIGAGTYTIAELEQMVAEREAAGETVEPLASGRNGRIPYDGNMERLQADTEEETAPTFTESTEVAQGTRDAIRKRFAKGVKLWRGLSGRPRDPGDLGQGTYHSTQKARAQQYGRELSNPTVRLRNPLILSDEEAYTQIADVFNTVQGTTESRTEGARRATEAMRAAGYDGIVAVSQGRGGGELEVVVFPEVEQNQEFTPPPPESQIEDTTEPVVENRGARIVRSPEQQAEMDAAALADREDTEADLANGKITIRFLQSTGGYHIYSGSRRPQGLPSFDSVEDAEQWLEDFEAQRERDRAAMLETVTEAEGTQAITWDRKTGAGQTPNQADIAYRGFTKSMTPEEFRSLVPAGVSNEQTLGRLTERAEPIAPPFLSVTWNAERNVWEVQDHEGRSRSQYASSLGVDRIPVDFIPLGGLRAAQITEEMRNAPIVPQGKATPVEVGRVEETGATQIATETETETETETLEELPPAEPVAESKEVKELGKFIETVDDDATNLASPGTLNRRIKRALDKGWITAEQAAEVRRVQREMGSREDTYDAYDELQSLLSFQLEEMQNPPGQMEEAQEFLVYEDDPGVKAKRSRLRDDISKMLPDRLVEHVPLEELLKLTKLTAKRMVRAFKRAPSTQEISQVADFGSDGRFWYQDWRSIVDAMGIPPEQEYILAGILATTSPNKSVEESVQMTARILREWNRLGQPKDETSILDMMKRLKIKPRSAEHNNTVAVLMADNFDDAFAGFSDESPKVKPFYQALMGAKDVVVLDTWMARFFGLRPTKVRGASVNRALSARVRAIAQAKGWTPVQAQAAIWATTRYYGNRIKNNVGPRIDGRSRVPGIMAESVSTQDLIKNDDLATLLTGKYADTFSELGFDTAAGARELARINAARPLDGGTGGRTLGSSIQRTLGRRLEAGYKDAEARRNGRPVEDDSLAESTEQYAEEYADNLDITDPVRRQEATNYVAAVIASEQTPGETYPEVDETQTDTETEEAPAPINDLDAELLLGPTGVMSTGAQERLAAGEQLTVILGQQVRGQIETWTLDGKTLPTTEDFVNAQMSLRSPYQESVKIAFLDNQNRVIHSEILSMGYLMNVPFNAQMVEDAFQRAKAKGATQRRFMVAHNHPSGKTSPSRADITSQTALELYAAQSGGIMVDYVITNGDTFYSGRQGEEIAMKNPNRAPWEGVPVSERTRATPKNLQRLAGVLRQGNPNAEFIVYVNNRMAIMGVEQVPPGMSPEAWADQAMAGAAEAAANGVHIITAKRTRPAMKIVRAINGTDLLVHDASSTQTSSFFADGLIEEGRPTEMAEGMEDDQLDFGLEDVEPEVEQAAAPSPVVPPPPPPPPAASSQANVTKTIDDTGIAPDAAVSLNQKYPASSPAQWNVAGLSDADTEAIDAEGLAMLQNADDMDLALLGVNKTQVLGKQFSILGRRGLSEEDRNRAINRASRAFQEAGLEMQFDAENEVFRLADPTTPNESAGRALVEIVKRELALGADSGRPLLSVLVNSIRNPDGGLWVSPAFSEGTRNELFSLAQGEASFWGLMLGALHKHKRSLNFVAKHVSVYLNRAYGKAFGGEAVTRFINQVKTDGASIAVSDLAKKIPPKVQQILNRMDTAEQRGVDLDYFMGAVLNQIANGDRTKVETPEINQLPSLFDLANWRLFITQKGGNQLAQNILRMIDPQEQSEDTGRPEGSVKRMDRLLQKDLAEIVKEVIPQIEKTRNQPNFLQDLMTASGDEQSRIERLQVVDDTVRATLDEREARDMENEEMDPDEVEAKYEMIREAWDEQFTQISKSLTSDAMARRIINQHLKTVFDELNTSWAEIASGRGALDRVRERLAERIEETFTEFNDRAPEAAISPDRMDAILGALNRAFEVMARTKLQNIRANREAAAARRAEELPQRTAEGELNRLATLHSDVQTWTLQEENAVKEAIRKQRENPASREVFESTLIELGVSQPTARSLSTIVNRDIEARRRHAQLRKEQRVASPRPERGTQEEQERRTGIKGLVDRIFAATPQQQNDARWRQRTALAYFQENGLTRAEAEDAWNHFKKDFVGLLRQAAKRGLDEMRRNLSSRERRLLNAKQGGLQLWQRLERAINAGVFDQAEILKEFADEFGWIIPTQTQIDTLKALAAREQQLSEVTEDERQQIEERLSAGLNVPMLSPEERDALDARIAEAVEAFRLDKAAATSNERLNLQNQMHSLYARFSRPMTLRTAEGRRNMGEAGRELISANMLLKLGFTVKQFFDVGTQFAVHAPFRAIASAYTRYKESKQAGDPTEFWTDVSDGLSESLDTMRTFAAQAVTQFGQGMSGQGVRRNIEGMRSTISGFDRMKAKINRNKAEIERLRNLGGLENLNKAGDLLFQNALMQIAGLAEYSLRFTRAMDNIQGVFVEQQEIRERLITELLRYDQASSPTRARKLASEILQDWTDEKNLAIIRANQIAEENSLSPTPNQLRAMAYEVFKARQYGRMKAAGLDANQIQEYVEVQRQTVGWNMPEETGIGGAIGMSVRALGRTIERQGLPLPVSQFSNAIAIGINRGLTWTPLGFFPGFFGGVDASTGEGANAWFRTPEDRHQRKLEAATGTLGAPLLTTLAILGMLRVWIKPPDDPEERRIWQKEGHRAGTAEFHLPFTDKFIPVSLTSGPMSFFRIPLTAIGAVQDMLYAKDRRVEKLEAQAKRLGVPVGDVADLTWDDIGAAASLGAFQAIMGGRTAGGAMRSFRAGTDQDSMTIKTAAASQLAPFFPGLPAFQEIQRGREIRMDPKRADILDMMFPTQGSPNRQYNFLSDELGPGTLQQMTQTLTGGTYAIVDPDKINNDPAYRVFRNIDYRPSPIERQKGVLINGEIRPLTDEEYSKAQMLRGQMLKEEVAKLDPNQPTAMLTRRVQRWAAITKRRALRAIKAEAIDMSDLTPEQIEQAAQEIHAEVFALPPDQRLAAYNEALASGRVPLSDSGEIDPDFLAKWNELSQTAPTP